MVDPVTMTAIGMVVGPIVSELAKGTLEDYVKDFFIGRIEGAATLAQKPFAQSAVKEALKEFATLFAGELVEAGLGEKEIKPFVEPLKAFVRDKDVLQVLGAAFSADCQQVDAAKLAERWKQVRYGQRAEWKQKGTPQWWRNRFPEAFDGKSLPYLPVGFDWLRLGEAYRQKVRDIVRNDAELRGVLDSQNLDRIADATIAGSPIAAEFDLEKYREGLLEQYDDLDLDSLSAGIGEDDRRLTVRDVFVPQMARTCQEYLPRDYELPKDVQVRLRERGEMAEALAEAEVERYQRAYVEQSPRSILEIIEGDRYPYIVVLGDPGSGKSMLLKYLALRWAKLSPQEGVSAPVPLLVELRKYVQNKEEGECGNFLEFIESGSGWVGHLPKNILHDWLKRGRGIVLFDGLDEVFDPKRRSQVIAQIHDFTQDYPNVKTIVTSRVIGYQQQRLKSANFHHVMLQDFTSEQVAEFIRRWHELAYRDGRKKAAKRERLEKAIAQSRAIRELAANPLLLTMMAIFNRDRELPRNRTKLYEEASKVLLYRWGVEGKEKLVREKLDPDIFDEALKQKICRAIAYRMQLGEKGLQGNIIPREELREAISECLTGVMGNQATVFAKLIIEQLRQRDFILCRLGGHNEDYFGFVHQRFLEYFCAWAFVWQFEKERSIDLEYLKTEVFGKHWHQESWYRILQMIAEMLDDRSVGEIIEYLLREEGESEKFVNLFLAATFLEGVTHRETISTAIDRLLSALKASRHYNLQYAYAPSGEDAKRVQQIRTRAVNTIAFYWYDDPKTLPLLQEWAKCDREWMVRRAALIALAWQWRNDPETFPLLRSKVRAEEHPQVRIAALEWLAWGWRDLPETLPLVKQLARSDGHWAIREAAVEAVAQGWKDDPETLPLLKQLAQSDECWRVQQAAIKAFVWGWKDDPETLLLLKQWAQPERPVRKFSFSLNKIFNIVYLIFPWGFSEDSYDWEDPYDRLENPHLYLSSLAVQELARGWKNDPNIVPWLKDLTHTKSGYIESLFEHGLMRYLRGFWLFEIPILLEQIEQSKNARDWHVRQAAMRELARGWKEDEDTLPWLKDLVQNNREEWVRQAAVREVARGWKEDADTLPWLKDKARNNESENVRQAAVEELARGWQDDGDTLPFLKDKARNDESEWVRQAAVEELARGWQDDGDTLPFLKDKARNDENEWVRQAAVEELARGWQDEPGMFELLSQIARTDPFVREYDFQYNPRKIALEAIVEYYPDRPEILQLLRDRAANDTDKTLRQFAEEKLAEWEAG